MGLLLPSWQCLRPILRLNPQLMLIPQPGTDITTVVRDTGYVTTENAPLMLNPKRPLKLMLMLLPTIMVDTMDIPDTTDMDTDTDTVWDTVHTMVDITAEDTTDTEVTGVKRRMSVTIPSQYV